MVSGEPKLFKAWDPYTKERQVIASAIIFNNRGWTNWQGGHAKLFGTLLWEYETKNRCKFKYSQTLKKQGYARTHNYRLLKALIEHDLLKKEGSGYYSFPFRTLRMIREIVLLLKEMDAMSKEEIQIGVEQKSQDTAS